MRTEFQAILLLLFICSLSFLICLFFAAFANYWIKYHPRKAKRFVKSFALFPVELSNGQTLWLKSYWKYQEYGAGMVLGGSIRQQDCGDGKITWEGSGSFIPSYTTYFLGKSYMGVRDYLREEGWESKKTVRVNQENNLKNLEKFFGKDLMKKWKNGLV